MRSYIVYLWKKLTEGMTIKRIWLLFLGAMICSFGIYNIHQRANITEGGIFGLMLLIGHWLKIPSSCITPLLDTACYVLAFKLLGGNFIKRSIVSTLFLSGSFRIWELFPPMFPDLSAYPLLCAIVGGCFVGIGSGLIVQQGGSGGGDDALALMISKTLRWKLSHAYLLTDISVLLLSLTYIPLSRIVFSLITVMISSRLIEYVKDFEMNRGNRLQ